MSNVLSKKHGKLMNFHTLSSHQAKTYNISDRQW